MRKTALAVSSAAALALFAVSANAQMQQKQPEGATPSQAPSAPSTGGERAGQPDMKERGAESGERKAEPKDRGAAQEQKGSPAEKKAQSPSKDADTKTRAQKEPADKSTKGAQGEPKDKATKGQTQTEPADKGTKGRAETQPADKGTKGTAGDTRKDAPKSKDAAQGPDSGSKVQVSQEQRTNVHQTLLKERNVNRVNINVSVNIGTRVPRSVRLVALPATIIAIAPAYRSYRYFVVDDRICIVDPGTYEIVDVIVESGHTARMEDRGPAVRLVLTDEERAIVLREVRFDSGSTLALGALTEGADVPRDVELITFSDVVVQKVPKLRGYKYVTAENRLAIIGSEGKKVQLVIEDRR